MNRHVMIVLSATLALVATACGTGEQSAGSGATPAPSATGSTATAAPSDSAVGAPTKPTVETIDLDATISHVHGLVVDGDGSLRAGTHEGVRVITTEGKVSAVGPSDDLMGMTGTPGTGRLISSGHPGPGSAFPNPVGLIRSDDGGKTWESVSLAGEIDFHALAVADDYIAGFDGITGILISTDGGATWTQGAPLGAYSLAAVGDEVWAATPDGLAHSSDRGARFAPLPDAPDLRLLSAGTDGSLWGIDASGTAWRSEDGRAWQKHRRLADAEAIAAWDAETAYAVNGSSLMILRG